MHYDSRQVLYTNLTLREPLTIEGDLGDHASLLVVYTRPASYIRSRCFSFLFFARLGHAGDDDS